MGMCRFLNCIRTGTTIDMVKICITVLVCSVTGFTIETRDAGPTATAILHDHGLAEVFLQLQRIVSLFHKLRRLWEVNPFTPSGFLP